MALMLLVVLATPHLEDTNLVVLTMRHHRSLHARAGNQGSADLKVAAVTNGKHLVDHDLLANVRSNLFYLDLFARSNLVLLAAGFYDRVHISPLQARKPAPTSPLDSLVIATRPGTTNKEWRSRLFGRARDSSTKQVSGSYPPRWRRIAHFLRRA